MLSLIESPNGLKFENIYVFSKSLYQPKYEYLEKLIKPIKGMHSSALAKACEKQNNIHSYFCMGRHKNIDSFHLCQTYTHIPKHLIRHIYRDHVNTDMSYDSFMKICQKDWGDKYGFLIISKDNDMEKKCIII